MTGEFKTLEEIAIAAAASVRPPERLTVAQAAAKYRHLNNRNAYSGPWLNEMAPYLVEPMNLLTSHAFRAVVLVAPAQCGKTEVFLNWLTYTVICDPADMMFIDASMARASDFSMRRIERLHTDTPEVGQRIAKGRSQDNRFNKRYRNRAMVSLSWPTINELSGKPVPRVFLTDYDRMDQDVGGEGSPFALAQARTTTFRRAGMTVAESSPSFPIRSTRWVPKTPHEAPPAGGILALYNAGDRRRYYWVCVSCGGAFEPDLKLLEWDDVGRVSAAADSVRLKCPHCGEVYRESGTERTPSKMVMNRSGVWLRDGEKLDRDGCVAGDAYEDGAQTASFWLKGVCATFSSWSNLVAKYLEGQRTFETTGDEELLKSALNTGFGLPYLPASMKSDRVPEALKEKARPMGQKEVPPDVRFLVGAVDVQKNRFVVQIHGVSPGNHIWVIDRFDIRYSRREAEDREGQVHFVRPFVNLEDWYLLLSEVILKTYPLADSTGRSMQVKSVICDTGGAGEATSNAYNFWKWLKSGPNSIDREYEFWSGLWVPGVHARLQLYKGTASNTAPRTKITYPDSGRTSKHAGARGEVPVLMANVTPIKNQVDAALARSGDAKGQIFFPDWLDIKFYNELCVEVKNSKGVWENPQSFRNESWDLLVMAHALLIERRGANLENIDWRAPPSWAQEWHRNDLVVGVESRQGELTKKHDDSKTLADLAGDLA